MSVLRIWKNGVQTGEISDKRTGEPAGETAYETTAKRQMNQQVKNQMKQQRKEQIKQTKQDERRRNTCGNIRKMSDRELRSCRRAIRLRRARRRKAVAVSAAAVFCVVLTAAIFLSTIRTSASSGFKYYTGVTVEAGESLWEMAERYIDYSIYQDKNSYLAEVKRINHLDEDGAVFAGQLLVFPYYSTEYIE